MSKRLQVVMDDAEYDEIQAFADARRLTVSAWVRQVLRDARSTERAPEGPAPGLALREPRDARGAERLPAEPHPGAGSEAAPPPSTIAVPPVDAGLVRAVMERHGFRDPADALRYALGRAAEPALPPPDLLALRGSGWSGALAGGRDA